MFVDRRQELDFLNSVLTRSRSGPAQLVLMYVRRHGTASHINQR